MRRFYTPNLNLKIGQELILPESEAEHLRRSLRMRVGDPILIFNGEAEANAVVSKVSGSQVAVMVQTIKQTTMNENLPKFTLFQGLIRLTYFELIVQKLTELGVTQIVPLSTEFSQVQVGNEENKRNRWQKIIIEACKQSERNDIPELSAVREFADLPDLLRSFDIALFFTTARTIVTALAPVHPLPELAEKIKQAKKIAYLIGPEGGFSPLEHKQAAAWGIPFVTMGPQILKAETAAIAAQATLNYIVSSTNNNSVSPAS